MIIIAALILGAAYGAFSAKRRGGNKLDMLQYAAVYALIYGLVGVVVTIVLAR